MTLIDELKKKKKRTKKWWWVSIGQNEYFFLALPLAPFCALYDKIKKWHYESLKWNDEKAHKVIHQVLVEQMIFDSNKGYYYYGNGHDLMPKKRNKQWAKKFRAELRDYLIKEYKEKDLIKVIEPSTSDSIEEMCYCENFFLYFTTVNEK